MERSFDQDGDVPRGRRWRLIWVSLALLIVIGTGIAAWRSDVVGRADAGRHEARLRVEREEIAALPRGRPPVVEPRATGDAATVVAAFLDAVHAVPEEERNRLAPFVEDVSPEERDAILAAHPEPLARLESLLAVPSAPPPPSLELVSPTGQIERIQAGARWLVYAADRALARGDLLLARRIALLVIAYGGEVAWGGNMVYDLVAGGVETVGAQHLAAALSAPRPTAVEARRTGAALDRLATSRLAALDVLAVERASLRARFLDPALGRTAADRAAVRDPALNRLDAALDEIVAALPLGGTNARSAVAAAKVVADREDDPALIRMFTTIAPMWLERRFATIAWVRVVRTALAVSEAEASRGAIPGSLAELVPEFLPEVPVDPWDGRPLRYRAGTVWSIGRDGKDDGGALSEDPDDTSTGDYAATVPPP